MIESPIVFNSLKAAQYRKQNADFKWISACLVSWGMSAQGKQEQYLGERV